MNIAWTYLLHAHYRKQKIEYRYYEEKNGRKIFGKTSSKAHKFWGLEHCLNHNSSPIDSNSANNLRFLIGIRHEIEHRMTARLDNTLSAKFQACCLNYNEHVKKLFGDEHGIDKYLALSLQFSSISQEQANTLPSNDKMPAHVKAFVQGFEGKLTEEEYNSPKFAYRVLFIAKTANHKGQADQVIEFVKSGSELAENVNKAYTIIKETERPKLLPSAIIKKVKSDGFPNFNMTSHTELWKKLDAKNPTKGYGVQIANTWYWYESWYQEVLKHCRENSDNNK